MQTAETATGIRGIEEDIPWLDIQKQNAECADEREPKFFSRAIDAIQISAHSSGAPIRRVIMDGAGKNQQIMRCSCGRSRKSDVCMACSKGSFMTIL